MTNTGKPDLFDFPNLCKKKFGKIQNNNFKIKKNQASKLMFVIDKKQE